MFGIVIGFSLFTALVALVVMTLIRSITGRLMGVLGLMAPRSIIRSLSRTSVAVAALMVAVSVIVGVTSMVGSFRNDVETWLGNSIRADILISPPSVSANRQEVPVDPKIADVVRNTPGIALVGTNRNAEVTRPGDALPIYLSVVDEDISQGHRRFTWAIGDYDTVWNALGNGAVIVSEAFARHRNIPIGPDQSLTLITDKGEHTFPIAAVMYDYSSDQGMVLKRPPIYESLCDGRAISSITAFGEPGAEFYAIIHQLRGKLRRVRPP